MTESLKIKESIKKRLERFWSNTLERGGFLMENRIGVVDEFIPLPNCSLDPKSQYLPPTNSLGFAQSYAKSRFRTWTAKGKVVAFFHTHPTPCVMSAADLSASGANYPDLFFVTISPLQGWGKDFIWYACRGVVPKMIEFVEG